MDKKTEANQDDVQLMDHEYDGIREYDNPLPSWWLMTFLGAIIFSFNYFIHYTWGGGQTQAQELEMNLKDLPKALEKIWQENDLIGKIDAPEVVMKGKMVFGAKCSACHGQDGQGVIGPNLTDKFWLHGEGQRKDIIHTVSKGVLEKGMPAWEGMITEDEMLAVTGYIYSLRGTNPPNPKEPQGQEFAN